MCEFETILLIVSNTYRLLFYACLDCIELAAGTVPEGVTHVTVAPLASIPDAVTVQVEPLTTSDWECLEVYAELLEEGGLLQQVTVVYPNQALALRVGGEMVRAEVMNTDGPCCRLLADTEVLICPKPRACSGCKQSPLLRVVPSWDDFSPAMQNLARETESGHVPIHVAPCTVLVHPATLGQCGFENGSIVMFRKESTTMGSAGKEKAVARVQTSELVAEDSVGE